MPTDTCLGQGLGWRGLSHWHLSVAHCVLLELVLVRSLLRTLQSSTYCLYLRVNTNKPGLPGVSSVAEVIVILNTESLLEVWKLEIYFQLKVAVENQPTGP